MSQHIGLGTAAIGRPQYINIKSESGYRDFDLEAFRARGFQVLDQAYERGIRYFDTAPGYGMAEEMLIEWLSRKNDKSIEIATKWGYTYVADFNPDATQHEVKEHSLDKLREQWQQSKKLLPFLSTYQIHSATFATGVLENQAVLSRLAEIKANHGLKIGMSTTGADQLEVLKKALGVEVDGHLLFDAFQVTYNILDQSIAAIFESDVVKNKRFIIKEALANGRLFPNPDYPHYQPVYAFLATLAEKYQVGPDAIALRFCLDSIHPYSVLSGVSMEQHLQENLKANQFELTEAEVHTLRGFKVAPAKYWQERSALAWN